MKISEDREQFELAAKAAGYGEIRAFSYGCMDGALLRDIENEFTVDWNPKTDDGDALRLAVKLNLDIRNDKRACFVSRFSDEEIICEQFDEETGDACSAARLAIFRAAVEIGRAMKCE